MKEVLNIFDTDIRDEIISWGIGKQQYVIEGSIGEGRTLETPWVVVRDRSLAPSVSKGIYMIYIYAADMRRVFISLMMGCSFFCKGQVRKSIRIKRMVNQLREMLIIPEGFSVEQMHLSGRAARSQEYELANIFCKEYMLDTMPDEETVKQDFINLLRCYNDAKSIVGNRSIDEFFAYQEAMMEGLTEKSYEGASFEVDDNTQHKSVEDKPENKRSLLVNEKGKRFYPRDPKKKEKAIQGAKYLCEYDKEHFSFWVEGKKRMYVEAHHLIPLSEHELYEKSLDVEANIVSLCPNCHRCIHHGDLEESRRIVEKLLGEREERLKKCGIIAVR